MIHKLQKALIGLGQQLQNSPKAGFWIRVRVSIPQGMDRGQGQHPPGNEIEFLHPAAANAGLTLEGHQLFLQYSGISPGASCQRYLVLKEFGWQNLPVFQVKSCRSGVPGTEGRDAVVLLFCQSSAGSCQGCGTAVPAGLDQGSYSEVPGALCTLAGWLPALVAPQWAPALSWAHTGEGCA